MSKKKFVFNKIVYLCDTNAEGNVYFAKYFEWQGQAREEFVKINVPTLLSILQSGIKLITYEAYASFKKETILYDEILIEIKTKNIKKLSLDLVFIYTNKKTGELVTTGWERLAFADATGNLIPIPEDIKLNALDFLDEQAEDNLPLKHMPRI